MFYDTADSAQGLRTRDGTPSAEEITALLAKCEGGSIAHSRTSSVFIFPADPEILVD
jgi:hypothetical protein